MARRTTARVQCGAEATWQSRGWPAKGQVARIRGRRPRRWIHADAREGRYVAGEVGIWRAHGLVGPG